MPNATMSCPFRAMKNGIEHHIREYHSIYEACRKFWVQKSVGNAPLDRLMKMLIPGAGANLQKDHRAGLAKILVLGKRKDKVERLLGLDINAFAPGDVWKCPVIIKNGQNRKLGFHYADSSADEMLPSDKIPGILLREIVPPGPKCEGKYQLKVELCLEPGDTLLRPSQCMMGSAESTFVDQKFRSDITAITGESELSEVLSRLLTELKTAVMGGASGALDHDYVVIDSKDNWMQLVMLEAIKERYTFLLEDLRMDRSIISAVIRTMFLELGDTGLKKSPHLKDYPEIEDVCLSLNRIDEGVPLLSRSRFVLRLNAILSVLTGTHLSEIGLDTEAGRVYSDRIIDLIISVLDDQFYEV